MKGTRYMVSTYVGNKTMKISKPAFLRNYTYIKTVSKASSSGLIKTRNAMVTARNQYGITFYEYMNSEIFKLPVYEQKDEMDKIVKRRNRRNKRYEQIAELCGTTKENVIKRIAFLRNKNIFELTHFHYDRYEMYYMSDEEATDFMHKLKSLRNFREAMKSEFEAIDRGEKQYSDYTDQINKYYSDIASILPESFKNILKEDVLKCRPDLKENAAELDRIAIDMEVTRTLLRYSYSEYLMFNFFNKTIEERRMYLSGKERFPILKNLNGDEGSYILTNKYECYSRLKTFYHRGMVKIGENKDYKTFKSFCNAHDKVVIKPLDRSYGHDVTVIQTDKKPASKALFVKLLSEYGQFVAEELVYQHPQMAQLNPDSVNTVRIVTYINDGKTIIQRPFMKIGRKGSFVDNGGSGGILVNVDLETGKLMSVGIDEDAIRYESHPDNGTIFHGYQLPNWEQALALANSISDAIPKAKYIGWDFACTKDGTWIIIEGNAMTQFLGQQSPMDKGMRKDFYDIIVK